MSKIKDIIAREIKDSREKPTVEVTVETDKGDSTASVPSGASTGEREALELRDADGRGVNTAINNINNIIAPKLKGKDVLNQREVDEFLITLDGTENKSKLGANAILGVSMAACRAGAASKKVPLYQHIAELAGNKERLFAPLPMFNLFEGGVHTNKETGMSVQEFMVVPHKKTMQENLVLCNQIFQNLSEILEKSYGKVPMGFEGGFEAPFSKTEQALYTFRNVLEHKDAVIALDIAASEFYKNGKYNFEGRELMRSELLDMYKNFVENFPLAFIEDPFAQEDWQGFEEITKELGQKITIVGDDLTTTNIKTIKEAHNKSAINAVLIKLNQIGSVSETIDAINMTKSFGWKVIVSHRSGETMDDFIADLAVGAGADMLKSGSPAKPERMVKYQRVIEIEKELSLAK
jgi:enolase